MLILNKYTNPKTKYQEMNIYKQKTGKSLKFKLYLHCSEKPKKSHIF